MGVGVGTGDGLVVSSKYQSNLIINKEVMAILAKFNNLTLRWTKYGSRHWLLHQATIDEDQYEDQCTRPQSRHWLLHQATIDEDQYEDQCTRPQSRHWLLHQATIDEDQYEDQLHQATVKALALENSRHGSENQPFMMSHDDKTQTSTHAVKVSENFITFQICGGHIKFQTFLTIF
ncbi:hypothetical protein DPMN_053983 [Dreissena polymorpha]|uniref:Uncharacterized protein n=1 Tax=Dreissena polymorpha TaxID=45954 RepID=A0A9D4HPB7_DREPO|nr:hypothetical protein DPMN_053983 [Dreissena polymorpha]